MFTNVLAYKNANPFIQQKKQNNQVCFTGKEKILTLSSEVLKIVDKVSISRLEEHLNKLTSPEMEGRGVGQKGIEIAKKYIADKFGEFGLKPVENLGLKDYFQNYITPQYSTSSFGYGNYVKGRVAAWGSNLEVITSNVLGMIKGAENPDEFLVISAHYDHLGKDARTNVFFPGADDNASGVAALIEVSRILAKEKPPKKSVIFAALSGEEASKTGAEMLAKKLLVNGIANKTEVLNLEMLGGIGGDRLDIWFRRNTLAKNLVDKLEEAGEIVQTKTQVHLGADPDSDALKFNAKGIPSVCVAWDYTLEGNHPYYHTSQDTADKINKNVFKEAVRLITASSYLLAHKLSNKTISFTSKRIKYNKLKETGERVWVS